MRLAQIVLGTKRHKCTQMFCTTSTIIHAPSPCHFRPQYHHVVWFAVVPQCTPLAALQHSSTHSLSLSFCALIFQTWLFCQEIFPGQLQLSLFDSSRVLWVRRTFLHKTPFCTARAQWDTGFGREADTDYFHNSILNRWESVILSSKCHVILLSLHPRSE